MPRGAVGWLQCHELALCLPPMPPEQRVLRRRQGWQWSVLPPEKLLPGLGWAGQLQLPWEHSGKQGAFVCCSRAGLASRPVPTGLGCCLAGLACPALATQCHGVPILAVPVGGVGGSVSTKLCFALPQLC